MHPDLSVTLEWVCIRCNKHLENFFNECDCELPKDRESTISHEEVEEILTRECDGR